MRRQTRRCRAACAARSSKRRGANCD